MRAGSSVPTSRTWSRPEGGRGLLCDAHLAVEQDKIEQVRSESEFVPRELGRLPCVERCQDVVAELPLGRWLEVVAEDALT